MAAPWLAWAVPSILSTVGSIFTNRSNRDIAREQMNFQERMSNTSAQRSVEDYRKAGLNPGLAYDRGASTPGGASATMGDAVSSGVNSAQAARALVQSMKIAKEQHEETKRLTRAQTAKTDEESSSIIKQREIDQRQLNFDYKMQPTMESLANAQALMANYQIPSARNTAEFEEKMFKLRPGMGAHSARLALEVIKAMRH